MVFRKEGFGDGKVKLSNLIESWIKETMLEQDGAVELKRNELASHFNCVPSQINYVIATRFSPERGYIVESRRGGGGYIRITQVRTDRKTLLMHVVNSVGAEMDLPSARAILTNLVQSGALEEGIAKALYTAMGERSLAAVPRERRAAVRADMMKQVLLLQLA